MLSKDFSHPLMQRSHAVQAWSSAVPALPLPAAGLGRKCRRVGCPNEPQQPPQHNTMTQSPEPKVLS